MEKFLWIIPLLLLLCFTISCQDRAAMAELEKYRAQAKVEEQNRELYRKMVEEWNKGNYEYLREACAPDYAYYFPSANPKPVSSEENLDRRQAFCGLRSSINKCGFVPVILTTTGAWGPFSRRICLFSRSRSSAP
jgi:hypothetical protein